MHNWTIRLQHHLKLYQSVTKVSIVKQVWSEFVNLSDEEQEAFMGQKRKTAAPAQNIDRGNTAEDEHIPTERGIAFL